MRTYDNSFNGIREKALDECSVIQNQASVLESIIWDYTNRVISLGEFQRLFKSALSKLNESAVNVGVLDGISTELLKEHADLDFF